MANRSARAETARETVEILNGGTYVSPGGAGVSIAEPLRRAAENTRLYRPDAFPRLIAGLPTPPGFATRFEVINCTTLHAARGLAGEDPAADVLALNFASAKNPGGGFLNGSQAQEESLARASGLYACISPVREYYDSNRACRTLLYTDHMIHSPGVPVFRDDDDRLLEEPYRVSMITAPACNAGAIRRGSTEEKLAAAMVQRTERLLAVAAAHGHTKLVLGAWGCGVFRNDPEKVAGWFHEALTENPLFVGRFERVVFAVLDRRESGTLAAFAERFGPA